MSIEFEVFGFRKAPKEQKAILLLVDSTPTSAVYVGVTGAGVEIQKRKAADFQKSYVSVMWGHEPYDPRVVALELLKRAPKISTAALDQLERILEMDTRGKSTEQIRQEMLRIAGELPKGHTLRDVPATFPDRGQAIAAYTALRQALYAEGKTESSKSSTTEKETANVETKAPKGGKAAAATPETKAPKGGKAAAAAAAPETKPAKGGKAAAAVAAEESKAKGGKAVKASAAASAGAVAAAGKAAGAAKPGRKASVDLSGPFKMTDKAIKAKEPSGLGMHEGSARFKLMEFMYARKSVKPVTVEELEKVVGDQLKQALSGCVRYEFLVKV